MPRTIAEALVGAEASLRRRAAGALAALPAALRKERTEGKIRDCNALPNWALQLTKAGLDFCGAASAHVCGGCAPAAASRLLDCDLASDLRS